MIKLGAMHMIRGVGAKQFIKIVEQTPAMIRVRVRKYHISYVKRIYFTGFQCGWQQPRSVHKLRARTNVEQHQPVLRLQ